MLSWKRLRKSSYPAEFGWSDLGSWESLRKHSHPDKYGNAVVGHQTGGEVSLYETRDCIIHTSALKKVVVQGLDGYVVVEKDGTLLICKLSEEERIRLFH